MISVFGLGRIGLPVACILASIDKVIGADINEKVVRSLNAGKNTLPNEEKLSELLANYVKNKRFVATTDLKYAAKASNIKVITVPLILDKKNRPDFENVLHVVNIIGISLKKEDLVIVSTTMPLGATRGVIGKRLEKISKLKVGKDFYLTYVPERAMNPHVIEDLTEKWHQIIGGVGTASAIKAKEIYEQVNKKGVIIVKNCETAEMIKILEGVYRYTNIALANQVAEVCEKFGIDFNEIREDLNKVPYYNLHVATVGVGGHCIPVYPHFLLKYFSSPNLIKASVEINRKMPKHAIEMIKKRFKLSSKQILVLGISYKGNQKEDRYSPAYDVIDYLKKEKAKVFVYDPFYSKDEVHAKTKCDFLDLKHLNDMDGVIVITEHDEFKNINFGGRIKFVFDGKLFLDKEKIESSGIKYFAIGRSA